MKHSAQVTIYLIMLFVCSQLIGVAVLSSYIDPVASQAQGETVFSNIQVGNMDIEPPPVEQDTSFVYIFIAILVGTALVLLIAKFSLVRVWKAWYFLALVLTMSIALAGLFKHLDISSWIALVVALILAGGRIFYPTIYTQNASELLIYAGLASIFVPVLNMISVLALLLLISLYDMYAVWKSQHMVSMANFQTKSNMFAGLYLPYTQEGVVTKIPKRKKISSQPQKATTSTRVKKVKPVVSKTKTYSAILGGGDIGFPLFFIGVVLAEYGLWHALGIIPFVTASLAALLIYSEKGKFYPAMPFVSFGCLIGIRIITLFF